MKRVFVLGLGMSGKAVVRTLSAQGALVAAYDDQSNPFKGEINFHEFDLFVPSPGIPLSHPLYQKAVEAGIQIMGEAELGLNEIKNQICIGITGTNGKTTVVKLVEHLLCQNGLPAIALGNIGIPLLDYATSLHNPQEIVVAELSSYQIESMKSRVLDLALILNISPNHLDRHLSMEEYVRAKCRLEICLKEHGRLFVHEDVWKNYSSFFTRKPITFGTSESADYWTDKSVVKKGKKVVYFLPEDYKMKGMHESENALAAFLIAEALDIKREQFVDALKTFFKPPHRIEFVKEINHVFYYNDSKSTNTDSMLKAIYAMQGPVVLIAGGKDKNISFKPLIKVKDKVKKILAVGSNKDKFEEELQGDFSVEKLNTLEEAVERASCIAKAGDYVLLSPGSSSFDMFKDYADRGEKYREYVHHIEERKNS